MRSILLAIAVVTGSAASAAEIIARIAQGANPQTIGARYGITLADVTENAPFALYAVPQGVDPHAIEAQMRVDPEVVWAEDNQSAEMPEHSGAGKASTIGAVGDPNAFYSMNTGFLQQVNWIGPASAAPAQQIRVAILDTGISPNQPWLLTRVASSINFVEVGLPPHDIPRGTNTNGNQDPDEAAGHGTMVAGIVAQMAPHSRLVVARICDSDGYTTAWLLIKGLAFAVNSGARVANISLGSLQRITALSDTLDWTEERNLIVVAAAGNNGMRTQFHPATISKVVSVTGIDEANRKPAFANWDSSVDSAAPATGMRSFYWDGQMAVWSGTSFAAPIVSAGIAIALEYADPTITAEWVRDLVEDTGDDIDNLNPNYRGEIGRRINIRRLAIALRLFN